MALDENKNYKQRNLDKNLDLVQWLEFEAIASKSPRISESLMESAKELRRLSALNNDSVARDRGIFKAALWDVVRISDEFFTVPNHLTENKTNALANLKEIIRKHKKLLIQ